MRLHPLVAFRECGKCRAWLYNEKDGAIHKRRGKDVPRGDVPTPCDDPNQGCAKGHWKRPKTLNWRNAMAYSHYQKCKAIGSFPNDDIVAHNARIIMLAEESSDKVEHLRQIAHNHSLLNLLGVERGRR